MLQDVFQVLTAGAVRKDSFLRRTLLVGLLSLWQRLHRNRKEDASEEYVERAKNDIALQPHLTVREHSYYTLQIFPVQRTVRQTISLPYRAIFSNHTENLHGHALRLFEIKWYPQLYNYTLKDGPAVLSGFVGRALVEYTKRRNAAIEHIQFTEGEEFLFPQASRALDDNTADIAPLFPIQYMLDKVSVSYPIHYTTYCLMVPVENRLSKFTFNYTIITKSAFVLFCFTIILITCIVSIITRWKGQRQIPHADYCVTFSVLQGLMGMPFWTNNNTATVQKFIRIMVSLAGIIIGTGYGTYLQSFTVDPPTEQRAENIGDLLNRGIKVAMFVDIIQELNEVLEFANYTQNLTIYKNLTELLALEANLDTRYAFLVPDIRTIYKEQQKYFSRDGDILGTNSKRSQSDQKLSTEIGDKNKK